MIKRNLGLSGGRNLYIACVIAASFLLPAPVAAQAKPTPPAPAPAKSPAKPAGAQAPAGAKPKLGAGAAYTAIQRQPWTGDLDGMIKRRIIRVLVPHNKTLYFVEQGQPRGVAYEALRAFEDDLNHRQKRGLLKVNVVFFPTPRDKLMTDLLAGLGDIVVASYTVTPEREKVLDFTIPTT